MRLPVVPSISTKDGTSNRNARLTNCLKESKKSGDMAVIRPGLETAAESTGNGNGLVVFNNELMSVYGSVFYRGVERDITAEMNPLSSTTDLITNGQGTFIATGNLTSRSTINVSTDSGETWQLANMPSSAPWGRGAWNGSVFVILAFGTNKAATSEDGINWTARTLPASASWIRVVSGGSTFCAIATSSATSITSVDGITWNTGTLPSSDIWGLLAWNGTVFCAIAPTTEKAATSSDGLTWSAQTITGSNYWAGLAWNGSVFVVADIASSTTKTSPTGVTWSSGGALPFSGSFGIAANPSGNLVSTAAAASDMAASSETGSSWGEDIQLPVAAVWDNVIWDGERFCYAGAIDDVLWFFSDGEMKVIQSGLLSDTKFDFAQSVI